jgi:uncharacterized protein YpmS
LEKTKKGPQEEHKPEFNTLSCMVYAFKWVFIVIIELLSIGAPMVGLLNLLSKDYRELFTRKTKENKKGATKNRKSQMNT